MTVKEALQDALALFGPNGEKWGQGDEVGRGREKLCALTAAKVVVYGGYRMSLTGEGFVQRLVERFIEMRTALRGALLDGRGVVDFNDDPETTFADIKALYERAIRKA